MPNGEDPSAPPAESKKSEAMSEKDVFDEMVENFRNHLSTTSKLVNGLLIALFALWLLPIEDDVAEQFLVCKKVGVEANDYREAVTSFQAQADELVRRAQTNGADLVEVRERFDRLLEEKWPKISARATMLVGMLDDAERYFTSESKKKEEGEKDDRYSFLAEEFGKASSKIRDQSHDRRIRGALLSSLNVDDRLAIANIQQIQQTALTSQFDPQFKAIASVMTEAQNSKVKFKLPLIEQNVPIRKAITIWSLCMALTLLLVIAARFRAEHEFDAIRNSGWAGTAKAGALDSAIGELPWWMDTFWVRNKPGDAGVRKKDGRGWRTLIVAVLVFFAILRLAWLEHARFYLQVLGDSSGWWLNYSCMMFLGWSLGLAALFATTSTRFSQSGLVDADARNARVGKAVRTSITTRQFLFQGFGLAGGFVLAGLIDCSLSRKAKLVATVNSGGRGGSDRTLPRFVILRRRRVQVKADKLDKSGGFIERNGVSNRRSEVKHFALPATAYQACKLPEKLPATQRPKDVPAGTYVLRPRLPGRGKEGALKKCDGTINPAELIKEVTSSSPSRITRGSRLNLKTAAIICEYQAATLLRSAGLLGQSKDASKEQSEEVQNSHEKTNDTTKALQWMLCAVRHDTLLKQNGDPQDWVPSFRAFDLAAILAASVKGEDGIKPLVWLAEQLHSVASRGRSVMQRTVKNTDQKGPKKGQAHERLVVAWAKQRIAKWTVEKNGKREPNQTWIDACKDGKKLQNWKCPLNT
ncbi:MAG: hypothetical protein K1X78_25060 [Verrucomicrobiaceae bacterium]|nr:hypothetical protein [Verrucomicrobiaceae bacterium]